MVVALDLFAEANPAFTTFVAVNFCRGSVWSRAAYSADLPCRSDRYVG
jgi:hypothetical protein